MRYYSPVRFLKRWFKQGLRQLGYEIIRTAPYGQDVMRDVCKMYGGSQLRTVIDAGAHVWETALEFVRAFPQAEVHSFEPSDANYDLLVQNTASYPRIIPAKAALGDENGSHLFYFSSFSQSHSLLSVSRESRKYLGDFIANTGSALIAQITLDHYCEQHHLERIDLLKMDVQGAELLVLKGAAGLFHTRRIQMVLLELNLVELYNGQATLPQIWEFMKENRFALTGLYDPAHSKEGHMLWANALFVRID